LCIKGGIVILGKGYYSDQMSYGWLKVRWITPFHRVWHWQDGHGTELPADDVVRKMIHIQIVKVVTYESA